MPIDFNNGEYYRFDFKKLTNILTQYYNSKNFIQYLDKWKSLLIKLDNEVYEEYNHFAKEYDRRENKPEFYQFSQKMLGNEKNYIFQFNIENILKNIKNDKYKRKITIVKKIEKIASYDKTIILDSRKVKDEPIVLCELHMPNFKYTVIDGNTRLNFFIKRKRLLIKYIIYKVKNKNDFMLSIDWATYNFIMEIESIFKNCKNINKIEKKICKSKIYDPIFLQEANKKL